MPTGTAKSANAPGEAANAAAAPGRVRGPRRFSPRGLRWLLNFFPPWFFGRIRTTYVSPDYRTCRVVVKRSFLTRNLNGTTFGGTLFSAADPVYSVLFWQIFAQRGERVVVWLKRASIAYLRPAAGPVTLEFHVPEEDVAQAVQALDERGFWERSYLIEAVDESGRVCVKVDTEIHLRR